MECDQRGIEGVRFKSQLLGGAAPRVRRAAYVRHGCFADDLGCASRSRAGQPPGHARRAAPSGEDVGTCGSTMLSLRRSACSQRPEGTGAAAAAHCDRDQRGYRMGPQRTLPWPHDSGGPVAELPPAQAPCGSGEGLQRPAAGAAEPGQHAYAGHAVPRLRHPSPSLRFAGDQRPHRPATAAACQPLTMPTCAGPPAWAEDRTAPSN
eukprot:80333-Chlamydomonas_euryale.AAC.2